MTPSRTQVVTILLRMLSDDETGVDKADLRRASASKVSSYWPFENHGSLKCHRWHIEAQQRGKGGGRVATVYPSNLVPSPPKSAKLNGFNLKPLFH